MTKTRVIFLHGVGSNGDDLAALGRHWASLLPDVEFAAPDAPFPAEYGTGFQWFSLNGITVGNRPARVREARAAFDTTLNAVLAENKMTEQWDKVILVGFSQGSIMALDALASGRFPLAGVVAFSGRLAFDEPLTPHGHTPVLLIHGQADDVISCDESKSAASRLKKAGVTCEIHTEPTTGHTISAQGAMRAAAFIAQCLQD